MKRREIILDFTSLLDVTLIVIFFFVLFSHLDSQANRARTDEKINELNVAIQQAEMRESKADALEEQLQKEIKIVTESGKRQGEDAKGLIDFNRGDNIKLILKMESRSWDIQIVKDEKLLTTIPEGDNFDIKLKSIFGKTYTVDNSIFCDFIYDGSERGTAAAYRRIRKSLSLVANDYKHLYISETNLAVGE